MLNKILLISLIPIASFKAFTMTKEEINELKEEYIRPAKVPHPLTNKWSKDKEKLGKFLFFDPRISGSQWISCATCHNPGLGFEDGLQLGTGHGMKKLGRHTPTIINLAWGGPFFWDGRAETLEDQALGPIESGAEMNMNLDDAVNRLKKISGYVKMFNKVFPESGISKKNIGKAIATFEREVVSNDAPFDKWIKGDEKAISEEAKRGFALFNDKAKCVECHSGWNFTDHSFHDIGLKSNDIGRGKFLPKLIKMQHAFKTPGLREIQSRAPYMHDGSKQSLREVVDFYNRGGDKRRKSLSDTIKPLKLTRKERDDLIAFLKTLDSEPLKISFPTLPQ